MLSGHARRAASTATRRRRSRLLPLAGLLVGVLCLTAGCGSSDDDAAAGTTSGGSTSTAASAAAKTVAVCFDGASPPQEFYDDAHKPIGSEVEMLQQIAAKQGWKLDFQQLQFNGLISALLSKHCDVVSAGLFVKPEREKVIDFVLNSINGQSLMVEKGSKAGITGYNDSLAGKKIGMPAGYATIPIVQKECAKIKASGKDACSIVQFGNVPDTYNSLKTDKVDTVIDATSSVGYFAAKNADSFQLVNSPPVLPSDVGFGVRKDDTSLRSQLQQGMDDLYSSGAYCKILTKWDIPKTALPQHTC
jgi:polar amino acid transport system substrate-binding protein